MNIYDSAVMFNIKIKSEGKYQESIQSNTKPEPEHHMGKWQKHKKTYITYKTVKKLDLTQQVTSDGQTRNKNNKKDPQKKHHLGIVSIFAFTGGLKHVWRYQHHPYF